MSQETACGSHENNLRHPVMIEAGNMLTLVDYGMGVDAAARIAKQYTDKCAECAQHVEELEYNQAAVIRLVAAIDIAIEAIERGSSTAPVLECLKAARASEQKAPQKQEG